MAARIVFALTLFAVVIPGLALSLQGSRKENQLAHENDDFPWNLTKQQLAQKNGARYEWSKDLSVGKPQMWYDIAMSCNGTHRAAVVIGGNIWTSRDGGSSWLEDKTVGSTKLWRSVKVACWGLKMIAVEGNGEIWMSKTGGTNWDRIAQHQGKLLSVAINKDASNIMIAAFQRGLLHSNNSGGTFEIHEAAPQGATWRAVAMSQDGKKRFAAINGGGLWVSNNTGVSWMECQGLDSAKSEEDMGDGIVYYDPRWVGVGMSGEGSLLTAVPIAGHIWRSDDFGQNWLRDESQGEREWAAVAVDHDGTNRIAAVSGGNMFLSTNSGHSWIEEKSVAENVSEGVNWYAVAITSAGDYRTGIIMKGGIWKRQMLQDEKMFLNVSSAVETDDFARWVQGYVKERGGNVTNPDDLNGLLLWYNGLYARQSFRQLRHELSVAPWVQNFYEWS